MSNLKNILEKYKARSGDEQDFADKHTENVKVTDAPGKKEHDAIHDKAKMASRKGKGYAPGEDEEVYEGYYSVADIASVLSSTELSEDQIEYVLNTLEESSPSKLVSMIDEAMQEFYEEASEDERKMLDEMMNDEEAYAEFVSNLFEEKCEECGCEECECDDDGDDADEDDGDIDVDPKMKKASKSE